MKTFKPTYLYVKTHLDTGLKYFGKTTKDPYKYNGSGKHWLAHCRKYGFRIQTEIIGYFTDKEECSRVALEFSKSKCIVESLDWANIIEENGLDGGETGNRSYTSLSDATKKKLSEKLKGKKSWNTGIKGSSKGNKRPRTEETKKKISQSLTGRHQSAESIAKRISSTKGKKRPATSLALTGLARSEETRAKISQSQKGKIVSEGTREKIKQARAKQIFSDATKEKLSGYVVVVDKIGNISRITKDLYESQKEKGADREYVFHNSNEGKRRKQL